MSEGFLDLARDGALDGFIGEREYYRSAFHSRDHIVSGWNKYFDVIEIIDAIAAVQDFVVLRARGYRYLAEHNADPKPFDWIATPDAPWPSCSL